MVRCINQFFIYDGEVLKNSDFNKTMISTGKSIYEVIRVIDGVPLFLEEHLERLMNSAKISDLILSLNFNETKKNILNLIEINEVSTGNVKIVFNYANNDKKLEGKSIVNNRFILYFINHNYPTLEQYENGVSTILFQGERNNPNAKIINLDFRNIVDREIKEKNVYEAILIDRAGNVTEGSKSNIFMVKGNTVITAPLEAVLPGVTRESILDVCINLDIEVKEKKVKIESMLSMDGVFITGTSPKILPVSEVLRPATFSENHFSKICSMTYLKSYNNEVILKIMKAYNEKIQNYIKNHKI